MRRSNLLAGIIGQAKSSYIQSGLHSSMDRRHDLAAWQWLFIFDGIPDIPMIVLGLGFLFLPYYPHNTTFFCLNGWEKQRAKARIEEDGKVSKKIEFDALEI
ncbi:unnamed protein product [Ambrosiozyma monospora]|uniref:Unnamed protein product n=1 Tax=Ambrosiozyma monospora TaxID=43982 RepID=A0A9W6YNZ4_AMBMO|nr:unnamed protein product [Ambrosiozyma monospora]